EFLDVADRLAPRSPPIIRYADRRERILVGPLVSAAAIIPNASSVRQAIPVQSAIGVSVVSVVRDQLAVMAADALGCIRGGLFDRRRGDLRFLRPRLAVVFRYREQHALSRLVFVNDAIRPRRIQPPLVNQHLRMVIVGSS